MSRGNGRKVIQPDKRKCAVSIEKLIKKLVEYYPYSSSSPEKR